MQCRTFRPTYGQCSTLARFTLFLGKLFTNPLLSYQYLVLSQLSPLGDILGFFRLPLHVWLVVRSLKDPERIKVHSTDHLFHEANTVISLFTLSHWSCCLFLIMRTRIQRWISRRRLLAKVQTNEDSNLENEDNEPNDFLQKNFSNHEILKNGSIIVTSGSTTFSVLGLLNQFISYWHILSDNFPFI